MDTKTSGLDNYRLTTTDIQLTQQSAFSEDIRFLNRNHDGRLLDLHELMHYCVSPHIQGVLLWEDIGTSVRNITINITLMNLTRESESKRVQL